MIELISVITLLVLALNRDNDQRFQMINLALSMSLWIYVAQWPMNLVVISLIGLSALALWLRKNDDLASNIAFLSLVSLVPINSLAPIFIVGMIFRSSGISFVWPALLGLGHITLIQNTDYSNLIHYSFVLIGLLQAFAAFWQRRFNLGAIWTAFLARYASTLSAEIIFWLLLCLSIFTFVFVIHSSLEKRSQPLFQELERYAGFTLIFATFSTGIMGFWALLASWHVMSIIIATKSAEKVLFSVPKNALMGLLLQPIAPAMIFIMSGEQALLSGSILVMNGLWLYWRYFNAKDAQTVTVDFGPVGVFSLLIYFLIISVNLKEALTISFNPLFVHLALSLFFIILFMGVGIDKKIKLSSFLADKMLFWGNGIRIISSDKEANGRQSHVIPFLSAIKSTEGFIRYNAQSYLHGLSTGLAAWAILLVVICLIFGGIYAP